MDGVWFAFGLTLLAGLFTGVGGLAALFSRRTNTRFLAVCLSFSAGAMLYISFVEIFGKALEGLAYTHGEDGGLRITTAAFFGGVAFIALINRLIPHREEKSLHRTGVMSATAIAVHNFPEGLVTFMAALYDPALGITIAGAIAIHNIPEGIATAAPIYYATGSKKKALLISVASGLTEPLGALVAYFLLAGVFDIGTFGISFAAVSGIMVYIALCQLLPAALKYSKHGNVMPGLFAGMAVMAVSLLFL